MFLNFEPIMGKKVLAVFYSQSGQLEEILDYFGLPGLVSFPQYPFQYAYFRRPFQRTGEKHTRDYHYRCEKYVDQRHGKNQTGIKNDGRPARGKYRVG